MEPTNADLSPSYRPRHTAGGEADYGLFLGQELVGVVEAKKVGATLGGVEAQTLAYASETLPGLQVPIQPLPFRYESTGVETFFTNGLDPDGRSEMLRLVHRLAHSFPHFLV
jgi:type I restriction enzyme R subunit